MTCHKELLTVQQDTQYNIYYAPDVLANLMDVEKLPSELKPAEYQLMGEKRTAVKLVRGKPGVEERRSESVSLKFAWTLGPENGAAFFRKKQQLLFNMRYTSERKSAESDSKNLPAFEDYLPDVAMPQQVSIEQTLVPSSSVLEGAAVSDAGGVINAANARELARNFSECSDPEVEMLSMSFANESGDKSRLEPVAKRPRYSKHGFEMGSSEMDIENLIVDKRNYAIEIMLNMKTHETRCAALPVRVVNTVTSELKALKTKAVGSRNKDLAADTTTLLQQWSVMDLFLKAIRDYGFELKVPRKMKAPNSVKRFVEAKTSAGQLFTDSLAPDVFSAYHVETAMQELEDKKYDFSQVDLLNGVPVAAPMASWDEETQKAHQISVCTKVWDRAIFHAENSASANEKFVPMEKWLSHLCSGCGPDDEIIESLVCPVLGRSVLHCWRIVIARLCLFRSLVRHPLGIVHACPPARTYLCPLAFVHVCLCPPVQQALLPFVCDRSRLPMFVCVRLTAPACH